MKHEPLPPAPKSAYTVEGQAQIREGAVRMINDSSKLAMTWNIETMKHIAIVGVAGLAGVATLANAKRYYPALFSLFGLSLALAVLTFYLGSHAYRQEVVMYGRRLTAYDGTADYDIRKLFAPRDGASKWLGWISTGTGFSAAFAAVAGLVGIGLALFSPPMGG